MFKREDMGERGFELLVTGGFDGFILAVGDTGSDRSRSKNGCARRCGPSVFIVFKLALSPPLTLRDIFPRLLLPLVTGFPGGDRRHDGDGECGWKSDCTCALTNM